VGVVMQNSSLSKDPHARFARCGKQSWNSVKLGCSSALFFPKRTDAHCAVIMQGEGTAVFQSCAFTHQVVHRLAAMAAVVDDHSEALIQALCMPPEYSDQAHAR